MLEQIINLYQLFKTLDVVGQVAIAAGALTIVLNFLIAVFLLIPGEQPEKALRSAVDFLAKLSRKKAE